MRAEKTHIWDMSRRIADELGFKKGDVLKVLRKFTQNVVTEVYEGKPVALTHFGTFIARQSSARTARNPKTGEAVKVGPRAMIKFRPYWKWKDNIKYEAHKADLTAEVSEEDAEKEEEEEK